MIILAIILGLLPGFAWLYFYLQEDLHPEPKKLIALTFAMGALFAILALALELGVSSIFKFISIDRLSIFPVLVLAFIEEIAKFGAAYFTVKKSRYFDEPVDAMIYMVVAALGFATVENLGVVSSFFTATGGEQTATLGNIFNTASLRFVGATLLHSLTSALVGFYWAKSIREFGIKRFIVGGLALATLLHAVFNYLIINYGSLIYSLVLITIIGFFILYDFEKLKVRKV